MSETIICGVDRTPDPRDAVLVAAGLARRLELPLLLVHVVPRVGGDEARDQRARGMLDELARALPSGQDVRVRIEHGHPADGLVGAARRDHAQLVVVGSHGPRAPRLGSISAEVSRCAPCPVVVVPPGSGHRLGSASRRAAAAAEEEAGRPEAHTQHEAAV